MSKCIQEDKLRFFLDGELSAAEKESNASHLASCAACTDKLEILRSESAEVESLLGSLKPEQALPTVAPALLPFAHELTNQRRAARIGWTAALSLGALAAVIISALLLLNRHTAPQAPAIGVRQPAPSAPAIASTNQSVQPKQAMPPQRALSSEQAALAQRPKHQRVSMRTPAAPANLEHFIRLDNDGPIESGLIYRVKLPGSIFSSLDPAVLSSEFSAEVIVDASGRPRAIRFLE
ncbi:MAG TPA: zf-HC2 domain-containing protein [Candidatus Acidoferrales bacterium]|jgi:hypothetical protein|nr:zf-HC2 domain-containing protein [Candidatus Acidoferrales bacterium]